MARPKVYKYGNKAIKQEAVVKEWNAALYIRLSREDGDKIESDSVVNQKSMLMQYAKSKSYFSNISIFSDDGYTGTNFKRPQFQAMMQKVEQGAINCIIVKDLSRFGREHIDVDNYLERTFPTKNIRFISVKERLDSVKYPKKMNSIEVPFINLMNEAYARDISSKTKASLKTRQKQGKYTGALAPYGYIKNANNKYQLLVDEEVNEVIQSIFRWYIDGKSINAIVKILIEKGIDPPSIHKAKLKMIGILILVLILRMK